MSEKKKKVNEKIRQICVNYLALLIEIAMNEDFKKKFTKHPLKYLRDQVGMILPNLKNLKIILDAKGNNFWPRMWVFFPITGATVAVSDRNGHKKEETVVAVEFKEALDVKHPKKESEMLPKLIGYFKALSTNNIPEKISKHLESSYKKKIKNMLYAQQIKKTPSNQPGDREHHEVMHHIPYRFEECKYIIIEISYLDADIDPLYEIKAPDEKEDIVLSPC